MTDPQPTQANPEARPARAPGAGPLQPLESAAMEAVVEQSPDIIVIHDGISILYVNRKGVQAVGAAHRDEVVGRSIWEFVPVSHHAMLQERVAQMLDSGRPAPSIEMPFVLPGLDNAWGEILASPLRYDGGIAVQTVIRDITARKRAEQALRESQARYQRLFEDSPIGLFRSTAGGRMLSANRALVELLGYPDVDSLLRTSAQDLYPDPADRRKWLHLALEEGVVAGHEMELRRRDGAIRRVRLHCRVRYDEHGQDCLEGSIEDVTARRATEAELERSRHRLDRAVAASGLGLWDWNIATGEILVDDRWFAMLGYEPGAFPLRYEDWLEMVHPEDRDEVTRKLQDHLAGRSAFYECQLRLRTRDGGWRWIHDRGQVVERDTADRPLRAAGTHRDVHERVEAEDALRRSEERLAGIVRAAPLGITLSRVRDGSFIEVNETYAATLGYEREELLQNSSVALGIWVDGAERMEAERRLEQHGHLRGFPVRFRGKDGRVHRIELYTELLDVDGELCALTLHQDVTESRQLEEQLRQAQKMEAIGRLAGGIAHDFNNLLTAITGHVNFLLDALPEGDERRSDAESIEDSAQRARRLTRQLLAFSRQQVLNPRVVDLSDVIDSFVPLLARIIGEDVDLRVARSPEPCAVRVDPAQLEQVVLNLAVNARDAMPDGGRLTIGTGREVLSREQRRSGFARPIPAGRYALLRVSDSGAGMPEATRARAFEPFFTTKPAGKGTGLGLSTVYGIVNQSEGYVGVESEVDRGTTFTLLLPMVDQEPEPHNDTDPADAPHGAGEGTILLVEDEDAVRTLGRRILARDGFVVHTAADGAEALQLAETLDSIDLLVTDIVMPGINGRELAERLRQTAPDLPVIYMSGYTADESIRDVEQRQGQFLEKPFTPAQLTALARTSVRSGS